MPYQLFGKLFKYTLLFLVVAELFSLLTSLIEPLQTVAFFVALLLILAATTWKLEYGFLILLAELFTGGKGHLFIFGDILSIRMGIFLIILVAGTMSIIKHKDWKIFKHRYLVLSYSILAIAIVIGLINGFLNNTVSNVIFDSNAWVFFILIPIFLHSIKKSNLENILQVFLASTAFIGSKTVVSLILFAHGITGIGGQFYDWIRNSGVGEITYVSGSIFRIFFQSQLYAMIGLLIALAILFSQKITDKKINIFLGLYAYLMAFTLLVSQSRSFWVGAAGAIALLFIFSWIYFGFRIKKTAIALAVLTVLIGSQLGLLQIVTGNLGGNVVSDRFKNLTTEAAGLSRINQLKPLTNEIIQQFIFGYGFGKTVTYISTDPRVVSTHPGGVYTTYAFEWGYLDIWLKLGLIGILAYGFVVLVVVYNGFKKISTDKVLVIGTLTALAAVLATNIFSPYLNHPLGIGYILLLSALYKKI